MEAKQKETPSIYLPGYEAQLNDDGAYHSKNKVETSAEELSNATNLERSKIYTIPSTEEETWNYRCSCTFQIVKGENDGMLHYAMRQKKQALKIGSDCFPIATTRIQNVMKLVMRSFNCNIMTDQDFIKKDESIISNASFDSLKRNLSSVSFVSSWNHDMDCIATFNYDKPIGNNASEQALFVSEAEALCAECNLTALILRSKGKKIITGWHHNSLPCIRDTINISIPSPRCLDADSSKNINISMETPKNHLIFSNKTVSVHYKKAYDAFQHPNHYAMLHALHWMITKMRKISTDYYLTTCKSDVKPLNLLEMYCGCGAHTMAIAKSDIFDSIITVELDNRLVEAFKTNADLNCLTVKHDEIDNNLQQKGGSGTSVHIFQGDAGQFSKKILKHRREKKTSLFNMDYNVLLLDPPRAGLDEKVCELAKVGSFEHIIYISCGREALKGDLLNLNETFEVVDCTIIDLFPRTDSVESLVHLRRRLQAQQLR
jgi:tRNA/tmRNA/rRNA uracil-C5-methylase (TrmA/RlmC/RlmD family)